MWSRKVEREVGFQAETPGEVRQRNDTQWLNSYFCCYFGRDSIKLKLESLSFRDRFDILLEKRLIGVAELRYKRLYGKCEL